MSYQNSLEKLSVGQMAKVQEILPGTSMKERFLDLGFLKDATVFCLRESYKKDMKVYSICGALIAIRNVDAQYILLKEENCNV